MPLDPEESFHPVVHLPASYTVLDLRQSERYSGDETKKGGGSDQYTIGRYNEPRPTLYSHGLFTTSTSSPRYIHMGIDIGAPVLTPVYSFDSGTLIAQGALPSKGDYGHSMVIEYIWTREQPLKALTKTISRGQSYWALYGHLSAESITRYEVGAPVERGEQVGAIGAAYENGGWPPHLHFQLSTVRPVHHDLPGAVSDGEHQRALDLYPDPRQVLGRLY